MNPDLHWFGNCEHDDWNRACRLLSGPHGRRRPGDNHIHAERDKLGCDFRKSLNPSLGPACLEHEIAGLPPPLLQTVQKRLDQTWIGDEA